MQSAPNTESSRLRKLGSVLGASIDAVTWDDAIGDIVLAGAEHASRYICICNVHSVVTSTRDAEFRRAVNTADMATPDGAPIAWAMRRLGFPAQERINGPDLMWKYLQAAQKMQQTVFFYGSTPATLARLHKRLQRHFPRLKIGGLHSPPFHPLAAREDQAEVALINRSGAHVVLVGLGCPKQEKWMAAHRGRIHAVMIGVGAAFDYHAGVVRRAPPWWQQHGLEWLYRLMSEPRRLLKRYAVSNTLFVIGFARQLFNRRLAQRQT